MKKLVIKMDREKILNDGIYNADKIERYIDSLFEKEGLVKADSGLYVETGDDSDYARFWAIIMYLKDLKWFCDYVSEFVWYNSDNSDCFCVLPCHDDRHRRGLHEKDLQLRGLFPWRKRTERMGGSTFRTGL